MYLCLRFVILSSFLSVVEGTSEGSHRKFYPIMGCRNEFGMTILTA